MDSATRDTAPPSPGSSSQREVLNWLIRAFLAWIFVYLLVQGQDGFFARTVDRIEALWVKLIFLNIPVQVLLTLAANVCAGSERPAALRVGLCLAALNALLISVHIILSVATA